MGRNIAVLWHALSVIAAGILYFFFVLPRWPEMTGETTRSLGTPLRVACGALIAQAALPVVFTLLRTRKPELGTPRLALSIRVWSIVAHVLAGVLIAGTAISEIWLHLDAVGRYVFGIYGAAAAIALLGIFAFYLSFVAQMPPPPPKPIKAKKPKKRRAENAGPEADVTDEAEAGEVEEAGEPADEVTAEEAEAQPAEADAAAEAEATDEAEDPEAEASDSVATPGRGLRNRRPTGKVTHRLRRRGAPSGVAVEE